jgi:hypothetical protein
MNKSVWETIQNGQSQIYNPSLFYECFKYERIQDFISKKYGVEIVLEDTDTEFYKPFFSIQTGRFSGLSLAERIPCNIMSGMNNNSLGIRIDYSLSKFITKLNTEGFRTLFCCSGLVSEHFFYNVSDGYLSFESRIPEKIHRQLIQIAKFTNDSYRLYNDSIEEWKFVQQCFFPEENLIQDDVDSFWREIENVSL